MDNLWRREARRCTRFVRDEEDEYIRRHCLKKKPHMTEAEAKKEAVRLSMKYFDSTHLLQEYQCNICERWHVGNVTNG